MDEEQSLKTKVIRGFRWTAAARLASQLATWAITVVVIRLLKPADYGLYAMATIFVDFLSLMSEIGLGPALVQSEKVEKQQMQQVFGLAIVANSIIVLMLFLGAPLIASFFKEIRLITIVRVLSTNFIMLAFTAVPLSILLRRMDFRTPAIIDFSGAILASTGTLILAAQGAGTWALVSGSVINSTWRCLSLNVIAGFRAKPSFSARGLGSFVRFGSQITLNRIIYYFYSQGDIFIGGRMLGKQMLGYYSIAMHLASLPVQRLSGIMNQVAFPAFSQIQVDKAAARSYLLKVIRLQSLIGFPVLWGISCVAPELVTTVLGSNWEMSIVPIQLLTLVLPLRFISMSVTTATDAIGRPDISLRNVILAAVIMPASFAIGCRWGIEGLSLSWMMYIPVMFQNLSRSLSAFGLSLRDVFREMAGAAAASCVMYVMVFAARVMQPRSLGTLSAFLMLIAIGAAGYGTLMIVFNKRGCRELVSIIRG